jgi:hypothetical protein
MAFTLENQRKLQDASFVASATLPATNNSNVTTTPFYLNGQSYSASEQFAVQVDIDPLANFGTAGALTVVIQDSADGVTFANISELGSTVVNANTTVTTSDQFRLPPTARAYIRGLAAISAINGNISANNVTVSLRF